MGSNPHYEGHADAFEKEGNGELKVLPKGFSIVWGNDSRYWKLPNSDVAPVELLQVCWLEVTSSASDKLLAKSCVVGFSLSLTPDAFGWGGCPLYVMAKRGKKGNSAWKKVLIDEYIGTTQQFEIMGKAMKPDTSQEDAKIYFGLYEVWSGKWKGGLKIHHAFVREAKEQ